MIISKAELKAILQQHNENRKGVYRAFIASHPSQTVSNVVGEGNRVIRWTEGAVKSIHNFLSQNRVPFFKGHSSNSKNRTALGEAVASGIKEIGGKLYNFVIGHFPDARSVQQFDAISIETLAKPVEVASQYLINSVNSIEGIALTNSRHNKPSFQEAYAIAEIHNHPDESCSLVLNYSADASLEIQDERRKPMSNLKDIKYTIQENEFQPSQLFSKQEIVKDQTFKELVQNAVQEATKPLEEKLTEYKAKAARTEFSSTVNTLIEKAELNEDQKEVFQKLVERKQDSVSFDPDNIRDSAKEFVNGVKTELDELAELGFTTGNTDQNKAPKKNVSTPASDIEKPEVNPFKVLLGQN